MNGNVQVYKGVVVVCWWIVREEREETTGSSTGMRKWVERVVGSDGGVDRMG